eukprot:CAMPEP_0170506504 /NCGR_PEP_ID=MMETSP0208-20121228/55163_1 /TAXON_ID=197538 /ORGANISM="Strombidium inclinatum, Strain S3" /LENGTH=63 /DNA_ID=CAMNT_0010788077 /DNA_START=90 /DNA_END=278 /DNA_ORIENTATION=-
MNGLTPSGTISLLRLTELKASMKGSPKEASRTGGAGGLVPAGSFLAGGRAKERAKTGLMALSW